MRHSSWLNMKTVCSNKMAVSAKWRYLPNPTQSARPQMNLRLRGTFVYISRNFLLVNIFYAR